MEKNVVLDWQEDKSRNVAFQTLTDLQHSQCLLKYYINICNFSLIYSVCKELTRFFIKHLQSNEKEERNEDMNLCCARTVYHISKQSLIGLFIEAGGKTHFMDSNKPLSLLNTQINYRLGNQNCNIFSPPVSTDPQFCFGL